MSAYKGFCAAALRVSVPAAVHRGAGQPGLHAGGVALVGVDIDADCDAWLFRGLFEGVPHA